MPIITVDPSGDLFVTVSPEDYEHLIQWKWSYYHSTTGKLYARRAVGSNRSLIYMHRIVLIRSKGYPFTDDFIGHHKDENSTNNTRDNLEWLTRKAHVKEHLTRNRQ